MNISVQVCPSCKHQNEIEAVVCGQCGATLHDPFTDPGAKTKTTDMPAVSPDTLQVWSVDENTIPERGIAFYIRGAREPAFIDARSEFVLGRKVGIASEGLLDLAPFGGYHLGLSRRHAVIRRIEHGYEVLDLGSVNGTWVNNERLVPHKSYTLASGSHLRIGSMQLFVCYRPIENQ
jgi:hypothetical protein